MIQKPPPPMEPVKEPAFYGWMNRLIGAIHVFVAGTAAILAWKDGTHMLDPLLIVIVVSGGLERIFIRPRYAWVLASLSRSLDYLGKMNVYVLTLGSEMSSVAQYLAESHASGVVPTLADIERLTPSATYLARHSHD